MLARDLDLNTGATSYHLRELARHGFVAEEPDQAHGRERWWRFVMADLRFPPRSAQDARTRAVLDEMNARAFTDDIAAFRQAQRDAQPDDWRDAFPYSRGTIRVTVDQLRGFFEEYLALLLRYSTAGDDAGDAARPVSVRLYAHPEAVDQDPPNDR